MKVAIFGLGSIGRRHAKCFKIAGASEVIGMDPATDRRTQFQEEFGFKSYENEAIAFEQKPNLIIIASPNRFHIEQGLECLKNNVPMMMEKPIGTRLEQIEDFANKIVSQSLFFHMGSNWKFHPAFLKMSEIIESGDIGRPISGQVLAGQWLPDWHPWEDYRHMYAARKDLGGGAIFDTHELDYLLWLLGDVKRFVGFHIHSGALEISTEDVASASIEFRSGALVSITTDYIQRLGRRRYLVACSEGTLDWEFTRGTIEVYHAATKQTESIEVTLSDLNEMYVAQAAHVLECVKNGYEPKTTIKHALMVAKLQAAWHAQEVFVNS